MNQKKCLIFDAGPLINFAMNGSLHILENLKKEFDGDFLIKIIVKKKASIKNYLAIFIIPLLIELIVFLKRKLRIFLK